jgi:hypothetical protein
MSPNLAHAQPPKQHFIYRCTVMDGVAVKPDGMFARDKEMHDLEQIRLKTPIVLDSETGIAKIGKVLIDYNYNITNHGGPGNSFQAHDQIGGVGQTLIIRVDLPAPYRMFATFGGYLAYSGTCERTPKAP